MTDLADRLFNCPSGLECGPCRRLIGDLIAIAESARELCALAAISFDGDPWYAQDRGLDGEAIITRADAAFAALDARLAEENK